MVRPRIVAGWVLLAGCLIPPAGAWQEDKPEYGKYLAVGERLILVMGGQAYQIEPGPSVAEPAPSGLPQVWERIERWWRSITH